jgi:signal transduction histidine kinase
MPDWPSATPSFREPWYLALESAGLGIWEYCPETQQSWWSPRCRALLGLPPATDAGATPADTEWFCSRVSAADLERFRSVIAAAIHPTSTGSVDLEYQYHWPTDAPRWFSSRGQAFAAGTGDQRRAVRIIGLLQDVTDRRQAQERLHALSQRLLTVQEEERQHLSRILVDEVGQLLTGVQFQIAAGPAHSCTAAEVLRDLTVRVRNLSLDLRPTVLDDWGLWSAVRWYVDRVQTHHQLKVQLQCAGPEYRGPGVTETAAFRIIQEALNNVIKHAETLEVGVEIVNNTDRLTVRVRDRGRGFDLTTASPPPGGGLSSMRARAELAGGRWHLETAPGAGTCVSAELPFSAVNGDSHPEERLCR